VQKRFPVGHPHQVALSYTTTSGVRAGGMQEKKKLSGLARGTELERGLQ
jgi:hypothetical protein